MARRKTDGAPDAPDTDAPDESTSGGTETPQGDTPATPVDTLVEELEAKLGAAVARSAALEGDLDTARAAIASLREDLASQRRRFDAAWRERWGGEPYSGDSKPMQRRGRLVFDASFAATIDGARVTFHPGDPVPDNLDPAALPVGVCKEQLS